MKSFTVTLGKKEYTVEQLTIEPTREIRNKFADFIAPAVNALQNAPSTDMKDYAAIAGIINIAKDALIGYTNTAFDLLCEYSPEIKADRELIEKTAYDDEVMVAFVEVVKLLFPFEGALKALSGLNWPQTSKK